MGDELYTSKMHLTSCPPCGSVKKSPWESLRVLRRPSPEGGAKVFWEAELWLVRVMMIQFSTVRIAVWRLLTMLPGCANHVWIKGLKGG